MDKLKQKMTSLTQSRDEALAREEEALEKKKTAEARAERVSLQLPT